MEPETYTVDSMDAAIALASINPADKIRINDSSIPFETTIRDLRERPDEARSANLRCLTVRSTRSGMIWDFSKGVITSLPDPARLKVAAEIEANNRAAEAAKHNRRQLDSILAAKNEELIKLNRAISEAKKQSDAEGIAVMLEAQKLLRMKAVRERYDAEIGAHNSIARKAVAMTIGVWVVCIAVSLICLFVFGWLVATLVFLPIAMASLTWSLRSYVEYAAQKGIIASKYQNLTELEMRSNNLEEEI